MSVIDIHTHAFPDSLAGRAVAHLEQEADWKACLSGKVADLVASMDRADIDLSVVCPIATKPEQAEGILKWCREIRSDRIFPFPSVHPADPDAVKWLTKIAQAKFAGIKLHPMYQDFAADEPRLLELYRAAAAEGLIVLIHCGRDVAFPMDDDRATPARIRRGLDAAPGLKLIATHMGGWRMWEEAARELVGTGCWLETSFSLDELPAAKAVEMIRAHGVERVLFGTDSPWADQQTEIARIRNLGLTPAEQHQLLFSNAAKLLGL